MPIQINQQLLEKIFSAWNEERLGWTEYKTQLNYFRNIGDNVPIVARYYSNLDDSKKLRLKNCHSINNKLWQAKKDNIINLEQFIDLNNDMYNDKQKSKDWEKQNEGLKYNDEYPKILLDKYISSEDKGNYFNRLDNFFSNEDWGNKTKIDWFLDENKDYYSELLEDNDSEINIRKIIDAIVKILDNTNSVKRAQGADKKVINAGDNILDVISIFCNFDKFDKYNIIDNCKVKYLKGHILKEAFGIYNLHDRRSFIYNNRVDELFKELFTGYENKMSSIEYVIPYYNILKGEYDKKYKPIIIEGIENVLSGISNRKFGSNEIFNIQLNLQLDQMIYFYTKKCGNGNPVTLDLSKNFWKLAPGNRADGTFDDLWPKLKIDNRLGYQFCNEIYGDLKILTEKEYNRINKEKYGDKYSSYSITVRFCKINKGDYICIISGKEFLGIAKATNGYLYPNSIFNDDYKFQTVEVEWLMKFEPVLHFKSPLAEPTFFRLNEGAYWKELVKLLKKNGFQFGEQISKKSGLSIYDKPILQNGQTIGQKNLILYGPPGTGKTYKTKNYALSIVEAKSLNEYDNISREDLNKRFIEYCKKRQIEFITFHQSYSYEDFIEGIKPNCENRILTYKTENGIFKDLTIRAKEDKTNNYVLIIDEINRGNIANIFGELITLIEEDKREGCDECIAVTLPYSKDEFTVPSNLYIIGTMNTADRSIEALDIALRRRFHFEEMKPKCEKLDNIGTIDLNKMLETINDRIEILLDNDHKIGHADFIRLNELKDGDKLEALRMVFKEKTIPLLQEYFFSDFTKIAMILGKEFLIIKTRKTKLKTENQEDISNDLESKQIYEFTKPEKWDEKTFISIYG